jgi:hypothetical protein
VGDLKVEGGRDESGSRVSKLEFGVCEKRKRQAGERRSKAILKNQQGESTVLKEFRALHEISAEYRKQKICPE